MYTIFTANSERHCFDPGAFLSYPPHGPGARFLGVIGGAYEEHCEEDTETVLESASALLNVLEDPQSAFYVDTPQFRMELARLLGFLRECDSDTIMVYSSEDPATVDDLLEAATQGQGADDWAMEVIGERAAEFLPQLQTVLDDPKRSVHHLAAVRLLLFCYPRLIANPIVERFANQTSHDENRRGALLLLAAINSDKSTKR